MTKKHTCAALKDAMEKYKKIASGHYGAAIYVTIELEKNYARLNADIVDIECCDYYKPPIRIYYCPFCGEKL